MLSTFLVRMLKSRECWWYFLNFFCCKSRLHQKFDRNSNWPMESSLNSTWWSWTRDELQESISKEKIQPGLFSFGIATTTKKFGWNLVFGWRKSVHFRLKVKFDRITAMEIHFLTHCGFVLKKSVKRLGLILILLFVWLIQRKKQNKLNSN